MTVPTDHIILFTRYPAPGKAKTRLIPRLGPEKAALLQRRMTEMVLAQVDELAANSSIELRVYYNGDSLETMEQWLGCRSFRRQVHGDLGEKMRLAFDQSFQDGAKRVIMVGADIPGLNQKILKKAYVGLANHDLVLGPAKDGGYYLIGLSKSAPFLFQRINWGSARVLEQTVNLAGNHNLSVTLLETLADVDRPGDLDNFDYHSLLK